MLASYTKPQPWEQSPVIGRALRVTRQPSFSLFPAFSGAWRAWDQADLIGWAARDSRQIIMAVLLVHSKVWNKSKTTTPGSWERASRLFEHVCCIDMTLSLILLGWSQFSSQLLVSKSSNQFYIDRFRKFKSFSCNPRAVENITGIVSIVCLLQFSVDSSLQLSRALSAPFQ